MKKTFTLLVAATIALALPVSTQAQTAPTSLSETKIKKHTVTVNLVDESGTALATTLTLLNPETGDVFTGITEPTDPTFVFKHVPDGTYLAFAKDTQQRILTPDRITVSGTDLTQTLTLKVARYSLSAKMIDSNGKVLSSGFGLVNPQTGDYYPLQRAIDGVVSFTDLKNGTYTLISDLPQHVPFSPRQLTIAGGNVNTVINLNIPTFKVSGKAVDGQGLLKNQPVIVTDKDGNRVGAYSTTSTTEFGTFLLPEMAAGTYTIHVGSSQAQVVVTQEDLEYVYVN